MTQREPKAPDANENGSHSSEPRTTRNRPQRPMGYEK